MRSKYRVPKVPRLARLLVPLFAVLWSCGSSSLEGPGEDDLAILFIGNSLTFWNDMPDILEQLLEDADIGPVYVDMQAFPNWGLMDHWEDIRARNLIEVGGWDVVAMQQGPSATEGRPSLLQYSALFAELIEAAGARPALYMVWPAEERSFDFDGVSDSYRMAAEQVDGLLYPGGEAWRAAWDRDSGLELYGPDRFHPSVLGSYLVALVIYEQLSGKDPRELPPEIPRPGGTIQLSQQVADALQAAAVEANAEFSRP